MKEMKKATNFFQSIVFLFGVPRCGNYGLGIKDGQKYLFDRAWGCAKVQRRFALIYKQTMSTNIWLERGGQEVMVEVDYNVYPEERPTMYSPGDPGGIVIRSVRFVNLSHGRGSKVEDLTQTELETIEQAIKERERYWA